MTDYHIESLISTFQDHSDQFYKIVEEMKTDFKEENPDKELPIHLQNDFNISRALLSICQEISTLKKKIK